MTGMSKDAMFTKSSANKSIIKDDRGSFLQEAANRGLNMVLFFFQKTYYVKMLQLESRMKNYD